MPVTRSVVVIPFTERVERVYRIRTDTFEDECVTVLVAVTQTLPFHESMKPVVEQVETKEGLWFGLFRVPKDSVCPYL